jgi:hypothetical protein
MAIVRHADRELEAHAQGRKAFWEGRAIWTNPLTGGSAREWAAGWKQALGELSQRFNGRILSAADSSEWDTVLALCCPDDMSRTPDRQGKRHSNKPATNRQAKSL